MKNILDQVFVFHLDNVTVPITPSLQAQTELVLEHVMCHFIDVRSVPDFQNHESNAPHHSNLSNVIA